jgi:hypothetical protein
MIGRRFFACWQETSVKHERGNLSKIATSIPFSIRKESFEIENLEALLFGQAGLLDVEKR